jgi:micrococcal nuclease
MSLRSLLTVLLLLPLAGCPKQAPTIDYESPDGITGRVRVNGMDMVVSWSDGDSWTFLDGRFKGKDARLVGYNTLENWGPCHRWGDWTGEELLAIADRSTEVAASKTWDCSASGKRDSYGRILVACPDAALHLIERGLAHVYAFKEEAHPRLLLAQKEARLDERGMWEKGRPETLLTNVSATDGGVWMSVIEARTGQWSGSSRQEDVTICGELCVGNELTGSCMLFVPYSNRYRNRPECIAD